MRRTLAVLLFATLTITTCLWAADDPLIGTWKLDRAKSTDTPGPGPQSQINKYEAVAGGGIKCTIETVSAQGQKSGTQYTAHYDAKDYPVTDLATGKPNGSTVSFKRVDAYTTVRTNKNADGKVTGTINISVSKDGKTLTSTSKGTNAQGQPTSSVHIYNKQ